MNQESRTAEDKSPIEELTVKYLPYLQEIQKKLFIIVCTIIVSGIFGFIYYQEILKLIMGFFELKGISLVLTSPYQFFDLAVNTGLATGIITAFPLFIYFIVGFLKPALAPKEFRIIKALIPVSLILFLAGFAFGSWVMQFVISIYSETATSFNIGNIWDVGHFFAQTIIMGVCLGLVFEMPVVLTILMRLKLVTKSFLSQNRKYFYTFIILVAAFMPPSDIISLGILTIVPLFLFELALVLNQ